MWRTRFRRKPAPVAFCRFYGRFSGDLKRLSNRASRPKFPRRRKGGTTSEFSTRASPACVGCVV